MNSYIWGNLAKANNDPKLIDEAIAEAIGAHNSDPNSHLQPGAALEGHREADVMDHPAESVVNDKLQFKTRAWTAIVDPSSEHDFQTVQGAVEYVNDLGGGSVFIRRGRHPIQGSIAVDGGTELHGEGAGETVLYGAGNSNNELNFSGGDYSSGWNYGLCTFLEGDDSGEDWTGGPTAYMAVQGDFLPNEMKVGDRFFFNGDSKARTITYASGYGVVQFTPIYTPQDLEWDIKTYYYIMFTNNSKTASLIDYTGGVFGWDNRNLSIFDKDGKIMAKIETFNSATNTFTLQEAWPETSGTRQAFVGVGYGERNNIKGITFEGGTKALWLNVTLDDSIRPLSSSFSECSFEGNNMQIGMVFDESRRARFDSCTFNLTKTGLFHVIENAAFQSCKFIWARSSAQALELRGVCDLSDCLISNVGYASGGLINAATSTLRITDSTLQLQKASTLGKLNSGMVFLTDNSIEILSSGHLTVRGQQVAIADNIVKCSSTGRLVITGGSCLLSSMGNITTHIFTTTGVLQKIENNLVRVW